MATEKQFEANRQNAQKSTGPKTPEGRAAVRLNGVKHGLTAETIRNPHVRRGIRGKRLGESGLNTLPSDRRNSGEAKRQSGDVFNGFSDESVDTLTHLRWPLQGTTAMECDSAWSSYVSPSEGSWRSSRHQPRN